MSPKERAEKISLDVEEWLDLPTYGRSLREIQALRRIQTSVAEALREAETAAFKKGMEKAASICEEAALLNASLRVADILQAVAKKVRDDADGYTPTT